MGANKGRGQCKTLQMAPLCAATRYGGPTLFPFIKAILSIKLRNSLTLHTDSLPMNNHDNAVFKTECPKNQTDSTMYMKIRLADFWATLYMHNRLFTILMFHSSLTLYNLGNLQCR